MATTTDIKNLIINKVESQTVFDYMLANGLLSEEELYLVQGEDTAVLYTAQELTDEQKTQVRANIGAVTFADLQIVTVTAAGLMSPEDKVKLDGMAEGAKATKITINTWTKTVQ